MSNEQSESQRQERNWHRVTGRVLEEGSADPVFGARVIHSRSRLWVTTDPDGRFVLELPAEVTRRRSRIRLVSNQHWPGVVRMHLRDSDWAIPESECALRPMPKLLEVGWGILGFFLPVAYRWLLLHSRLERALVALAVVMLLLPLLVFAVDRGLPVPFTDLDDSLREVIRRSPLVKDLSSGSPVRYSGLRQRYYEGVRYVIPSGEHTAPTQGIVIERGATVRIEPGTRLRMPPNAGVTVYGLMQAQGTRDARIEFVRAEENGDRWDNIAIVGAGSSGTELRHCRISGGAGRAVTASDTGFFELGADRNRSVGGGLLIYDTTIAVEDVEIRDCRAVYGGGVYIRNPRQRGDSGSHAERRGSRFDRLWVEGCLVTGLPTSGGGAVMVKETFPGFYDCDFRGNRTEGQFACGGAVYVGVRARARIHDCRFKANTAAAEGGAIYIYNARETDDEHASGVVIRDCEFHENRSHISGGAISGHNSRLWLEDVRFEKNAVSPREDSVSAMSATGGAVRLFFNKKFRQKQPVAIHGCDFLNNSVTFPSDIDPAHKERFVGGALAIQTSISLKMQFRELTFSANHALDGNHVAIPPTTLREGWDGLWDVSTRFDGGSPLSGAVYVYPDFERLRHAGEELYDSVIVDRQDLALPNSCWNARPAGTKLDTAVLHFISAVNLLPDSPYDLETIVGILRGDAAPGLSPLSSHFLIDRDGTIYRLVDEQHRAWHAGRSRMPDGREDVNDFSIGVEMVRLESEPPTPEQYDALVSLLLRLKTKYSGLSTRTLVGHDTIRALWNRAHPERAADVKRDPGPLFDWPHVVRRLIRASFDEP